MKSLPTKDRLIQTAIELIGSANYSSVSVGEICKAAEVHKGSFYHHFPSKVDLAIAAIDTYFAENKAEWDALFSPTIAPLTRIVRICDYAIDFAKEEYMKNGRFAGCPLMALGSEMACEDGDCQRLVKRCQEADMLFQSYWTSALRDLAAEGYLEPGVDVEELARFCHTFVVGQKMEARVHNSFERFEKDFKKGVFRILGISIEEAEKEIGKIIKVD